MTKFRFALICLSTVLILQGCAAISGNPEKSLSTTDAAGKQLQEPRRSSSELTENDERTDADRNLILSEGYSQLYEAAQGLKFLDEALLLKVETDDFQKVAENTADYFARLEKTLEQLNRDYPSLRLDNNGLPVLMRMWIC
ncbi:hypothetical protein [Granulosicoccus antarcticus]|uniref:hypothetical protein n=1 Tax=Granulosicoccus antarcticus TaxID=437505 RepID=UPI00146FA4F4|nr:hypothetical protein [Granulosicoccus antarcticus]